MDKRLIGIPLFCFNPIVADTANLVHRTNRARRRIRRCPAAALSLYSTPTRAGIAQLVERQLPKLDVAGSNPVARSTFFRRYAAVRGGILFI